MAARDKTYVAQIDIDTCSCNDVAGLPQEERMGLYGIMLLIGFVLRLWNKTFSPEPVGYTNSCSAVIVVLRSTYLLVLIVDEREIGKISRDKSGAPAKIRDPEDFAVGFCRGGGGDRCYVTSTPAHFYSRGDFESG